MPINLYSYQREAIENLKNGSILCGGVGSGKSRTALAYYYICNGGDIDSEKYSRMKDDPQDLYIITTARKRDTAEWLGDMTPFLITTHEDKSIYNHKVVVDSWNNIGKYADVENSFFIFDEQRVIGYGAWTKAFLKIARCNNWILLSATPGDTWMDYMPVFIANGFYKNKTEFIRRHVVYSNYSKFPKVDRYLEQGRLQRLRNYILVDMDFKRQTIAHNETVICEYDRDIYKSVMKNRWDIYKDEPIVNASGLCYTLRRIINSHSSRLERVAEIVRTKKKVIIFYNFDYELELLKEFNYEIEGLKIAEWNGHNHEPIPEGEYWIYLVQYTAGAEGWNCIETDTIIFYSQNYSYKIMVQSSGRIDRLNTPFKDLYFYHLKSHASLDLAIAKALRQKKKFNERSFCA